MAIDYMIDAPCIPRDTFTLLEMLGLMKDKARAEQVVAMYRSQNDLRPVEEIGFEVSRLDADGNEFSQVMIASDAFERFKQLDAVAAAYDACTAFKMGGFLDNFGAINYPIGNRAEIWLLEQLPGVEDPLLFLMLMRTVQEFGYTGDETRRIRDQVGVYFQNPDTLARRYTEMDVTTDILFEMTFLLGHLQPAHAVMLLFFYNAIPRDSITPEQMSALWHHQMSSTEFIEQFPFLHQISEQDEDSVLDMKRFLWALYRAYALNVPLLLDV